MKELTGDAARELILFIRDPRMNIFPKFTAVATRDPAIFGALAHEDVMSLADEGLWRGERVFIRLETWAKERLNIALTGI